MTDTCKHYLADGNKWQRSRDFDLSPTCDYTPRSLTRKLFKETSTVRYVLKNTIGPCFSRMIYKVLFSHDLQCPIRV